MNASKVVTAIAVLTVASVMASPVWAQRGNRGQSRGQASGQASGQAVQRVPPRGPSGGPPPGRVNSGPPPNAQRPMGPGVAVPRTAPPYQSHYYGRPSYSAPYPSGRYNSYARPYSYPRSYAYGRAPYYGYGSPRYYAPHYGYGYGGYGGYVRPYYYSRPYYAFRPWFSIGFGISMGYPIAYPPYAYVYPYATPYAAPYSAPYSAPNNYGSVVAVPGATTYGGVSFQITPTDAVVYVDGNYVGPVGYFGPNAQPLTLTPGSHHIEVQAPGYQTIAFDVNIVPGQVIPYQGAMVPY